MRGQLTGLQLKANKTRTAAVVPDFRRTAEVRQWQMFAGAYDITHLGALGVMVPARGLSLFK